METFRMMKAKKGLGEIEEIAIAFIETAFNAEQNVGVCLIEFKTPVKEHLLKKQLEDIGATQVTLETFPPGDANETASSALLHIWMMKDKTELGYGNGVCSTQLSEKTMAKYNAEKKRREEAKLESGKVAEDIKKVEEYIAKIDALAVDNKAGFVVVDAISSDVKDTKTTLATMTTLVTDSLETVNAVSINVGTMATVLGSKIDEKSILAKNLHDKNLATEKAQNKTNYDKSVVTKKCNVLQRRVDELEHQVPKTILQLKKELDEHKLKLSEKANADNIEVTQRSAKAILEMQTMFLAQKTLLQTNMIRTAANAIEFKIGRIDEMKTYVDEAKARDIARDAEMKTRDEAHSAELLARDIAHSAEMKRYHDEAKARDDAAKEYYKRMDTMFFAMQTELGVKRNR